MCVSLRYFPLCPSAIPQIYGIAERTSPPSETVGFHAELKFSADAHAHSFAIPSKLEETKQFQKNIAYALPRLDRVSRNLCADITEDGRIAVGFGMYTLGYVQKKHECWVRPLVEAGPCFFYLLQVTGGTKDKPTRGVNVCIYNLAEAVQACAARMDLERFARLVS